MLRFVVRVLLLTLLAVSAQAQTATLVRDILSQGPGEGEAPDAFYSTPEKLFFFGDGVDGWGVWASDGTSAGTTLLVDLCPQQDCYRGSYGFLGDVGGTVLWISHDGSARPQLWRSDGTRPGTFQLAGAGTAIPDAFARWDLPGEATHVFFQGAFYFEGCTEVSCAVYRVSGSATEAVATAGDLGHTPTVVGNRLFFASPENNRYRLRVTSDPSGPSTPLAELNNRPDRLTAAGDKLFFVGDTIAAGQELWVSDGTPAGTKAVTSFAPEEPLQVTVLHPFGNRVYFGAYDGVHIRDLWVSDGTAQGTRRITNLGSALAWSETPGAVQEIDGKVVFMGTNGNLDAWVWTTNGNPSSTAEIPPCPDCKIAYETPVIRVGSRILFVAGEFNLELWSSDGTAAGTRLVKEMCADGYCNGIEQTAQVRSWPGGVLFPVDDGDGRGMQLWTSDGTTAGTRRITEAPGQIDLEAAPVPFAGRTWFSVEGDYQVAGLWSTDGNPSSSRLVAHLGRTEPSSRPGQLEHAAGRLYFIATVGSTFDLWSTLGSPESTAPLPGAVDVQTVARAGNLAYYLESSRLWRTDGTPAGTLLLRDGLELPGLGPELQGRLYFRTETGLWRSDGTVPGTFPVFDFPDAPLGVNYLSAAGGKLWFLAHNDLWSSDGTAAGTIQLREAEVFSGDPQAVASGAFVYLTFDGYLWKSNGTPAGTQKVVDLRFEPDELTPFQNGVAFFSGQSLWRSDGTEAGTFKLAEFPAEIRELTALAGKLFFQGWDGEHGFELWTSDGTPAGTVLLRDIFPGERSSHPRELTVAGGKLFFTALDAPHGRELWMSDGTAAGTRLVHDILPYADSSVPEQLTAAGDRLYFIADDGLTGYELWTLVLSSSGCQPAATRLCLNDGRFQVEAAWKTSDGNRGNGQAVALTADTGYFWFFSPSNVESVIKVLDGRGVNGHYWTFYGALSNVEYHLTVTDTQTGATRRYYNPQGQLASVGDTNGFGPLGAFSRTGAPATIPCQPSAERLCLNNGRFAVEATWKDFQGNQGTGKAVNLTSDTGWFWFFDSANVELVLKVLDGTAVNGKHWVFYGALSSVEYTITVTDTQTGVQKTYRNPSGNMASVADTGAF